MRDRVKPALISPGERPQLQRVLDDSCDSLYDSLMTAYLNDPGVGGLMAHVYLPFVFKPSNFG